MKKIIHIPHTSKYIPEEYLNDYIIDYKELEKLNEIYHDKHIIDLVDGIHGVDILKFEYSRLFCDVERFNDNTEIMNKWGRGVLYTHDHNLSLIRSVKNKKGVEEIYNLHHKKLTDLVDKHLLNGSVLIIDLHSYSEELLIEKEAQNLPELCIGVNNFHSNSDIFNKVLKIIQSENIIYNINYPYNGSIVPIKHYNKDKRVTSIMLDFKKDFLRENLEKTKNILRCIIEI